MSEPASGSGREWVSALASDSESRSASALVSDSERRPALASALPSAWAWESW